MTQGQKDYLQILVSRAFYKGAGLGLERKSTEEMQIELDCLIKEITLELAEALGEQNNAA